MTPPDLSGFTALVTGASRGIGREIAIALAERGAHLIAVARTVGALEELDDAVGKAGGKASLVPADLADPAVPGGLAAALAPRFPAIDILVLNAAQLGALSPVTDYDDRTWSRVMEINFTANRRLLKALDPQLRASGRAKVVALTSRVAREPEPYWSLYGASKAALENMLAAYAAEMRIAGVAVALVDPGRMRTKLRAEAMPGENPASLPDPVEVRPLLWRALAAEPTGEAVRIER
ncbi:MAG: SDR family NAD(P)-dependent oxidoreductase [Parvularculaceae bacterium]|nr:SDR family NAD(P)-dependent oxidoreductase [Parvularculaceae bacterium]